MKAGRACIVFQAFDKTEVMEKAEGLWDGLVYL
jgi:hypothetical protein